MSEAMTARSCDDFRAQVRALRAIEGLEAEVRQLGVDYMLHAGEVADPVARIEELQQALHVLEPLLERAAEAAGERERERLVAQAHAAGVPEWQVENWVLDRLAERDRRDAARELWNEAAAGRSSVRPLTA